jgi:hypothetical protein
VPKLNLGRDICGFPATVQANDGIGTISVHSSFLSHAVELMID